jgi:hypothetical protein
MFGLFGFIIHFFRMIEKMNYLTSYKKAIFFREKNGAAEGVRTLDIDLGKVAFYH